MTIKHLVLSGGGYNGIDMIGIMTELTEKNLPLSCSKDPEFEKSQFGNSFNPTS